MATAGAALRLRLLYRMLRVGELLALAVLLSWSTSRVPSAAAALLRLGGSLLLNPRFVFVLGNAIVLLLLALSRRDPSLSPSSVTHPAAQSTSSPAAAPPAAVSFPPSSFTTPAPAPMTPLPEVNCTEASSVVVVPAATAPTPRTIFEVEDKLAVRVVTKARAPRRSRSEKMGRRAASPEMRRSESDNGRRRRSSATARDAQGGSGGRWAGMDDAEEFRRTVEAFIAKQTRFHREEESMTTTTTVDVAGHAQVAAPATIGAGALTVVE